MVRYHVVKDGRSISDYEDLETALIHAKAIGADVAEENLYNYDSQDNS